MAALERLAVTIERDFPYALRSGDPGSQHVIADHVASHGGVAVRDTTVDREGVTLAFSAEAWQQLTRRLRS
jgi:hypothetical protein